VNKLKVCYAVPHLGYRGTTRIAQCLARFLDPAAFEFSVLTFRAPPKNTLPRETHVFDISHHMPTWSQVRRVKSSVYAHRVHRTLRKEAPDVVIGDVTWLCNALAASRLLTRVPRRLVVRMGNIKSQAWAEEERSTGARIHRWITGVLFSRVEGVIVPSNAVKQDLVSCFGVPEGRIFTIPNPIDLAQVSTMAQETVEHPLLQGEPAIIVAVGAMNNQKNHALLIRAFGLLQEKKDVRLVLVGDGPERPQVEKLVKELGVSKDVWITGHRDNPYKYLAQATVLVHPAKWEGFGYAVLEAMACGVPVIAGANSGGPAEIVRDEVDGLLVRDMSPEPLAEAILTLLDDEGLRTAMGKNAIDRASEYDAQRIVPMYERVIVRCARC